MKKRVLSMLLAFILCFSTLPMTAFAQEADAVTEQEEQQETDSAEEQEKQQEADSAEEQKEAEAAAAPGEETPSDKSTTVGEAPDTVEPSVESVSDSDAGTQDTAADDEKKAAVKKVQALIDALPDEVTVENAESVGAQLEAIDDAMAELTEEQREELDMTRLYAISEALNTPMTVPMTVAEGKHTDHPICGATCTDGDEHGTVTDWQPIGSETELKAATEGHYYLTQDIETTGTWKPNNNVVLCLNGHSIAVNADADAITVPAGSRFTLTDCNSSGGEHYFTKSTEKNNLWEPVKTGGDTTVTGGVITHSSGKNGSGISMGEKGTFTMYGGTICGNYNEENPGAGVRATQSTIIMSGGAISGNVAAKHKSGGGVYLYGNGGSFDMSGNAQITDNATNKFGGGVNVTGGTGGKASFTMSGNAQITGNICWGNTCGGAGLYASDGEFTMNDNAAISKNSSREFRGYGGGVFVSIGATFTMNGNATISRNSAYIASTDNYRKNYGGGVLVFGGTFIMNSGSIRDNMAENGAGVYVGKNGPTPGTFTMNGGTITNNKVIEGNGGGVYVLGNFEIANGAQVFNNSRQDTSGQDTSDNVYLTTGKTFRINGKLTGGVHSIGVSAADTPAEGSPVTIATATTGYTLTEEDADCFTGDADGIYPVLANNEMQLSTTAPHRHCLCGKKHHDVGDHTTDSQMTFTKLWMDNGILKIGDKELTATVTIDNGYFDQGQNVMCYELPAGNYYLGNNITLDYPIYIASNLILSGASVPTSNDVKLCLNGKTIKANGDFSAIVCSSVLSKTTFTLTDCQQTAGTITHAVDKTGSGVLLYSSWTESNGNGTRFNMYGGNITGNTAEHGGGVNIERARGEGGIFNLYGGVISGNKANDAGGGVGTSGRYSAFTMYDGEITNNTAGTDGGGVSSASAKFIMNGGSITGNTAATGGGVSVGSHGSTDFTMNGGKIKNNMASTNGGGVYMVGKLRSCTFTLNGTPDISENTKAGVANNVYLSSGAVITVGNLDANVRIPVTLEKMPTEGFYVKFAKAGAGLELYDNIARQFSIENDDSDLCDKRIIKNDPDELWLYVKGDNLHQHAICGKSCDHEPNHSKVLWTPLTYNKDTQQLMYGSLPVPSAVKEISAADDQGNPTKAYYTTYKLPAGNYYLADTIEMNGGSVPYNGNTVTSKGGVIEIETDVNLCLNGKWLVTSAPHVGVIVIKKAGALTLSDCGTGGRISSSCNAFAGVQIANDTSQAGTFTMYDGTIMNTATGVLMGSNSIFNMYGGTIANNETGVSVVSTSKLTVGDSAYIANNKKNVFLHDKAMIIIDSSLTPAALIGVTTETDPTDEKRIQIATGATGWVTYTEIFKPDGTDQGYVVTKDEKGNLYLNVHIHDWLYSLSANQQTIIADCNVTGCPNPKGGWVTIDKPEHKVYGDGKSAEATLILVDWQADEPSVTYRKGNDKLTEAPTDAGTYTASIIFGREVAFVTYEIQKATPAAENFVFTAPGSLTYDGTAKTADIKTATNITGMGSVTVKYYQGETEVQPMNAGEYKVKISVTDGTNFNAASDLTDESWAFTINRITTEPTVELSGNTTYTYTGERITPDVTVTIDGKTLTAGTDYTITYGDNVNAGTNAGSVTVKAKGNYGFADVVKKFTIEKADPKLSFEKPTVTTSYGTNPANNTLTNKGDGEVTYQSSNKSVATVNENGEVTVVGVGETTITATAAETTNYKVGTASYTLSVNKARVHIVQATVANKDYDGSVNADVTEVVFANEADVRIDGLVADTDYTVTGAFQSENAGEQDAEVTVKLLGDFDSHYELTDGTYKTMATITAKPISIATVLTQNRSYERNNTSVTILGVTFKDSTNTPVATLISSDYTATGKMVNANVGTDKEVTVTVSLQGNAAKNYSLVPNVTTAKVAITQANGGALAEENLKQKFSDRKQKTFTPDYTGIPAGETWTYSISEAQTSGTAKVEAVTIDPAGEIAYTLTDGAENDTIRWTVTISNPNYEKFTKDLVLTLTAKDPQETLRITGDNTVVYGQKLLLSTVGGSGTGEITYKVDEVRSTGDATIDENGVLTPVKVGSVVITATKAGDVDYSEITSAPFVIMITRAATNGEPKYNKITTGGMTLADAGLTLAGSTIHPADGILKWVDDNDNVLPDNTAVEVNKTYKWRFTPVDTNYEILTGEIELYHVEAPAVTAQPKSVSVTVGDTATFEVAATGTAVSYQWQIDRNDGNGFVNITGATGATYTTGVTDRDCNGFKYRCVLSNAADSVITDTVVLTVQYQIIEGANGSWNQNTNGGSLRIRGNGEFSKFQNVKVDGNIIDSKNYTVSEGSTIIELHADYLKTLSEGSHTFEIVWTDGAAGTGFTVARNTSGSNNTGSNNTGNNDNNDSTDNSAAAAPTAAATAQELDKVPATGDASGIWIALFVVSAVGLAAMLARRKKN